jgi:hypothetical protein
MTDGNQRTHQGRIGVAQALVVDGLPPCTIYAAEDGTWHVTAQLASDEQASLAASASTPDDLCRRAQHALGLSGIGSRIDRERGMVGVYTDVSRAQFGTPTLILDGAAMLWVVGHALPDAIRALVEAATRATRQSPDR